MLMKKCAGISVYSIDNRHHGIGDINHNFCIQSCSKTLTYALALRDNGVEKTNRHIGRENKSGARFNAFVFDDENKPFNPLINSGAIMSAALVKSDSSDDIRFEYVVDTWKKIVAKIMLDLIMEYIFVRKIQLIEIMHLLIL